MSMTGINENYTSLDHDYRDHDVYAFAKYNWTIRALKRSGINTKSRIANIGCGAGTFTNFLANAGYEVFSTEPDSIARSQAESNYPSQKFYSYGLFDFPTDLMFDVIVMHDVLEHIEQESLAIKHVVSHLNPGGYFLITVPAVEFLFGHHDIQLGHFRRYSRASMTRALSVDFDILRMRYFGFFSLPIVWLLSKKLKRDYPQLGSGKSSILQRAYGLVCEVEGRIPLPLGTAILVLAQSKR